MFKNHAKPTVNTGNSTLLWRDKWSDLALQERFPQLHSYARNKDITVQSACQNPNEDYYNMFQLPLSIAQQQYDEFEEIVQECRNNVAEQTEKDY